TAIFRRTNGGGNRRVTGNFAGHSEARLDSRENLASARTIRELRNNCDVATKTTRFRHGNIDPQRWDLLKKILNEALEQKSSAARITRRERRCGEDTDLLEEAESLLAEAEALLKEQTDSFEDCVQNAARTFWQDGPPRGGQRVGAYVFVREIG